jgi:hypothetical protein
LLLLILEAGAYIAGDGGQSPQMWGYLKVLAGSNDSL